MKPKTSASIGILIFLFLLDTSIMGKIRKTSGLVLSSQKNVWLVQESGSTASLRGVCAVSDRVAWASGSGGTFLRTTDGGEHWTSVQINEAADSDFRDIEAFDSKNALLLAAGKPARIYKTTNGGLNWKEVYHNDSEGIFLDAFAFFDEKNGIAVGDPMEGRFFVLQTSDGGLTWKRIPASNIPVSLPGEACFAASGTCLTVQGSQIACFCTGGAVSRVFYSKNGGWTWNVTLSPLGDQSASSGGFSIAFDHAGKNAVIVGGDYRKETAVFKNAALSLDGGRSWILVEEHPPAGFRECVVLVPGIKSTTFVSVGPSGSDVSTDGGQNWNPLDGPTGIHALSICKTEPVGWAVGKNGLMAKFIFYKKL
ncbi:MAG: oxidoreductase [Candidatus Aminicenantes bacterium]|nr:oxidoreductase [Candidatus Aminicenantes bacterium]